MSTMEVATYTDTPETSLVRLALEKGVDVEVLERLVALQERGEAREARAAFFEAVATFQVQCPEIRKVKTAKIVSKRTGGEFGYSYAPLEEIARTIRPILRANGLSYSWTVAEGEKSLVITCVLRHIEGHEERASFPVPLEAADRMSESQRNGAAVTYGKRQSLTSVLGITTADEDKDGAGRHADSPELTRNQADSLDTLMNEVGVDRAKFLKWLGVESIAELRVADYSKAVAALEARR